MQNIANILKSNPYPGRGIIIGRTADSAKAVTAYFIMGRSENSRNRVFAETCDGIRTAAFDESKLTDPSLVIYNAVRTQGSKLIITNGDQTDTIAVLMDRQLTFEQALRTREYEPDAPNYTPRISGILHFADGGFNYAMSILKSDNGNPASCLRYTFAYNNPVAGTGRFIHTYKSDGDPLLSFEGEPVAVEIPDDLGAFTNALWNALDADNKVSLWTRFINLKTGEFESRIVNKHEN
jgi:IMP cyclohydrolase